MLILFSVGNYRSFYDEQALSMVASAYYGKSSDGLSRERRDAQLIKVGLPGLAGKKYLRASVLYGANGSGKSNLTHAIATMQRMVLRSANVSPGAELPYDPFKLNAAGPKSPTSFFASFVWSGIRYEYSFSYDRTSIVSEELYSFPKGRPRLIFSRSAEDGNASVRFGSHIKVDSAVLSLVNDNTLLVSFLYGHPSASGYEAIKPVGDFFRQGLIVLDEVRERWADFPHSGDVLDGADGTDAQRDMIQKMVRDSDIGVTGARVETKQLDSAQTERLGRMMASLNANAAIQDAPTEMKTVLFEHSSTSGKASLPLNSESLGTNQIFSLSSYIAEALENGATLVVDELDASLHPLLCEEIIGLFERKESHAASAQLIFTAHQTSLMGCGLLERDQIWFANKLKDGSTELSPLSDYSPRKGEAVESGYLIGRYSGVPVLPGDYGITPAKRAV